MTRIRADGLSLREKLLLQGAETLSDLELLAVFINFGSYQRSCLQLAFDLMQHLGSIRNILTATYQHFNSVPGLGPVRYAQLQAVKEICRRNDCISLARTLHLKNSEQTSQFLKRQLRDKRNETFVALFLDSQHQIIHYEELFKGTINSTQVHIRLIIEKVLQTNAAALIVAHNHPSGVTKASAHDLDLTERLKQALEFIDTQLLDHLIIGDNEVYSIMQQVAWFCY